MRKALYVSSVAACVASLLLSCFFYIKALEQNSFIDQLISVAVHQEGLQDYQDIVLSLSNEIYRRTKRGVEQNELDWYDRLESTSVFNMTSAVSLKYNGYGIIGHDVFGPCGTMSRTLLNALWRLRIPARKLQLLDNSEGKGGGHTMIEFFYEGRWRVISPSDNSFCWRNQEGDIATASEIRDNDHIFSQIYTLKPQYRYLFDNPQNIRWEKLPPSVVNMIRIVIGEARFRSLETPRLYDQPRTLLFLMFMGVSALCGGVTLRLRQTQVNPAVSRLPRQSREADVREA